MDSPRDPAIAVGCPIRKSPDQSLLAAPRSLSQRATSFIASRCQGIRQTPFSRLFRETAVRREQPEAAPARHAREDTHHTQIPGIPFPVLSGPGRPATKDRFTMSKIGAQLRPRLAFQGHSGPLVEVNGLEPMTSCMQSRRSPD